MPAPTFCRKAPHPDRPHAERAMRSAMGCREWAGKGPKLKASAYRCRQCGRWHWGHEVHPKDIARVLALGLFGPMPAPGPMRFNEIR